MDIERQEKYEEMVADQAREIADLRDEAKQHEERTTRGFEAAARASVDADKVIAELRDRFRAAIPGAFEDGGFEQRTLISQRDVVAMMDEFKDLRERHETWVRKSACMLEVGDNERTDLRERVEKILTQWARAQSTYVDVLTTKEAVYVAITDRLDVLEKKDKIRPICDTLFESALQRIDALEKRSDAAADWREVHNRTTAERNSRLNALEKQVKGNEIWTNVHSDFHCDHDPTCKPEQTCETCEHYSLMVSGKTKWCEKIRGWADMSHDFCQWKPKVEQPETPDCATCAHLWQRDDGAWRCSLLADQPDPTYKLCRWKPKTPEPPTREQQARVLLERCLKGEPVGESTLLDDISAWLVFETPPEVEG